MSALAIDPPMRPRPRNATAAGRRSITPAIRNPVGRVLRRHAAGRRHGALPCAARRRSADRDHRSDSRAGSSAAGRLRGDRSGVARHSAGSAAHRRTAARGAPTCRPPDRRSDRRSVACALPSTAWTLRSYAPRTSGAPRAPERRQAVPRVLLSRRRRWDFWLGASSIRATSPSCESVSLPLPSPPLHGRSRSPTTLLRPGAPSTAPGQGG